MKTTQQREGEQIWAESNVFGIGDVGVMVETRSCKRGGAGKVAGEERSVEILKKGEVVADRRLRIETMNFSVLGGGDDGWPALSGVGGLVVGGEGNDSSGGEMWKEVVMFGLGEWF